MASRIATSRRRSRACASKKLARLAQATSSTSPTTTINAAAAGTTTESRSGLTAMSFSGMTTIDVPLGQVDGNRLTMSDVKLSATERARAIDAPGASRALRNPE
jgi:hypothetical protein